MSAIPVAKHVFAQRGVKPDNLAAQSSDALPVDEASEAERASALADEAGAVSPTLVRYTNSVLFGDLWRRPDLAPRDRSLVTVAALIAGGQADQLPFHMTRAMDNGLTETEMSEVITHLAFYACWPTAMTAIPVAKSVFATHGLPK
jgi:4-carboxymuconolactone decarboxylase